ncbi:MAG: ACT domain-containing protein [Sphingomonadaceae bacterium]
MRVTVLSGTLALCRLAPDREIPDWALRDRSFLSVTYTPSELSIVCPAYAVPADVAGACDAGWVALRVEGPLDHSLIGVLAALSAPLAEAGVPIFALSTYDTDYLLVMEDHLERARAALEASGHQVEWELGSAEGQ